MKTTRIEPNWEEINGELRKKLHAERAELKAFRRAHRVACTRMATQLMAAVESDDPAELRRVSTLLISSAVLETNDPKLKDRVFAWVKSRHGGSL